jgi:hypothetical protein
MSGRLYVPDVETPAWDNFVAQLDVADLERERMRAGDLRAERFGSREHHEAVWAHEVRRGESHRVRAAVVAPVWFEAWQLALAERIAAEQAMGGPVGGFAGRVASPAHENTSTEVKPANGRTVSHTSSTDQWKPETTKRKKAA